MVAGTVIAIQKDSFEVLTGEGILVVKELQLEGKKKMPVEEFLEEYTRLRPDRTGLSLTEAENGSCIFFEDGSAPRCRINPVKPQQCRDFPLKWNFPNWQSECKGKLIE